MKSTTKARMHGSRLLIKSSLIGLLVIPFLFCIAIDAAAEPWQSLNPAQREALAPLAQQWDTLTDIQQDRLIKTANRYKHLTAEHKKRFQDRLTVWSKLTPEQRAAAREKYQAFKKVPVHQREEVKKMVKEEQEKKSQKSENWVPNSEE
ncbi:MAG: DUF3106 domain-containing protein [Gallionella sp.]